MAEPLIRELASSDRAAVAFSLQHLGPDSRYQRWLGPGPGTRRETERLTDVDHWHHEGLIAFSPVPRAPIGLAEYVRLDDFELAELAITVSDGWQRRGIGRALALALRERARAAGVRRFSATVMRGNSGAIALLRKLGRARVVGAQGSVAQWLVELDDPPPAGADRST